MSNCDEARNRWKFKLFQPWTCRRHCDDITFMLRVCSELRNGFRIFGLDILVFNSKVLNGSVFHFIFRAIYLHHQQLPRFACQRINFSWSRNWKFFGLTRTTTIVERHCQKLFSNNSKKSIWRLFLIAFPWATFRGLKSSRLLHSKALKFFVEIILWKFKPINSTS